MKFPRLTTAEALSNFQLRVRFQDNTEADIDFREQLVLPVMRSIATPEAFARVRVAETGSSCYWDVDVPPTERPDASSDWLYLQSVSAELREEFETRLAKGDDWQEAAEKLLQRRRQPTTTNPRGLHASERAVRFLARKPTAGKYNANPRGLHASERAVRFFLSIFLPLCFVLFFFSSSHCRLPQARSALKPKNSTPCKRS